MASSAELIHAEIGSWPGVTLSPHRFGGVEFNLRGALIAGQHAEPHHVLSDSGWISFWLRSEADVPHAIWLLRLSYVRHIMVNRRKPRGGEMAVAGLDIGALIQDLQLGDALRSALLARAA